MVQKARTGRTIRLSCLPLRVQHTAFACISQNHVPHLYERSSEDDQNVPKLSNSCFLLTAIFSIQRFRAGAPCPHLNHLKYPDVGKVSDEVC